MGLLEYENQIFLECFHHNGLLITARGLGLDRIFSSYLNVFCDPASLVLVINTNHSDQDFFMDQLEKEGVHPLPKVITNEINIADRQLMYLEGGVQFITSRILVVDLLTGRVPAEKLTGILVYKAHKVIESCQEAFILRLYREKNKVGFIKAFSDTPEAFTAGFCSVGRMMKNLFVKNLFLWPRFQANVVSCLNQHKVDVVELHIQMTPLMTRCQSVLLDLINVCIAELKRCTSLIDMEEITVETALGRQFERIVRMQLDPVWHSLSAKSRQLVADVNSLRLILRCLTQYDCITFYNLVTSISTSERAFSENTGWLFLDSADTLVATAHQRVFGDSGASGRNTVKSHAASPQKKPSRAGNEKPNIEPNLKPKKEKIHVTEEASPMLEECPKWQALVGVLEEIDGEIQQMESCDTLQDPIDCRVLVCAQDDRTCHQLKEADPGQPSCHHDEGGMLRKKEVSGHLTLTQISRDDGQCGDSKCSIGVRDGIDDGGEASALSDEVTACEDNEGEVMAIDGEGECVEEGDTCAGKLTADTSLTDRLHLPSLDARWGLLSGPVTMLHPLRGNVDGHGLSRTLLQLQPTYIVLYDPDMEFVRQLEVYQASRPNCKLRVYFLLYTASVEEQRYLSALRREKEAFEFLIREKSTMVIPVECDDKDDFITTLSAEDKQEAVIVDLREFRSELPSLIHRRGMTIVPMTLEVGDYILTPDLCVERKSVSDLVASMNTGRLYTQCTAMCRCYQRPVLLIEFDPNKSFSLQGKSTTQSGLSAVDSGLTPRLATLTMHFPKLRILWCVSPYATAEIFHELKMNRDQPDGSLAASMTSGSESVEWGNLYYPLGQDMVLRMPGVTSKNYRCILNKFPNMLSVSQASFEEVSAALGNSRQAKQLHDFLHTRSEAGCAVSGKLAVKARAVNRPTKRRR